MTNEVREQKAEEWVKEGEQIFGKDRKKWAFKCVNCGHVQTIEDFMKLGMTEVEASRVVYFSCIGRWLPNCKGELETRKAHATILLVGCSVWLNLL